MVYGYSTGVFSSRKLEIATYDSVAFRYIAAGSHPDHDTLASFRRRFIDELAGLFVQVLEMATEMKLLKLGTVCLDGTKIHANASRHSALSHGHIVKLQAQLKQEVQDRLHKHSIEAATGLPASQCAVDAGVVNLWNTLRVLIDRQFFPLTSRVEHAQDVVDDRAITRRINIARSRSSVNSLHYKI